MACNNGENSGSEMEFEVNNQMGETGICEELTNNEIMTVSSEARGREEEDLSSKIQQTQTNLDLSLIHI